ncbi:MAG: FtsX-like permease family protein [Alphaproteobacteria bacterium]
MSDINLVLLSLKSRLSSTILAVLLTTFGISISIILVQFENHIKTRLNNDGKKIDIVVGAKGSPLQIVLSSIYHIDLPTGNIPYSSLKKISEDPLVDKVIPLALGDNWKNNRIVGTTYEYLEHYGAKLDKGRSWQKVFEVVAGSSVKINLNQEISGSHGLVDSNNRHDHGKYRVVGILKPTGTVLDRLLLTSLKSVLQIHGQDIEDNEKHHHDHDKHEHEKHEHDKHEHQQNKNKHKTDNHDHNSEQKGNSVNNNQDFIEPEITSLLITTKSPVANINLPRSINKQSQLQAANPAFEITRLSAMLGLGSKSFKLLSIIIMLIAVLSIFTGLASNFENRLRDLAILRAIGYSKARVFKIISLEGIIIVIFGIIIGLCSSFLVFNLLVDIIAPLNNSNAKFNFSIDIVIIICLVFLAGLFAAFFPAYKGSKVSVAKQLTQ